MNNINDSEIISIIVRVGLPPIILFLGAGIAFILDKLKLMKFEDGIIPILVMAIGTAGYMLLR